MLPEVEASNTATCVIVPQLPDAVGNSMAALLEAVQIMGLIETFRKTLETSELEARVAALEGGTA